MRCVGPVFLILLLATSVVRAQQAPVSIRGRVVAAENDVPLRRARIALERRDPRIQAVLTDEEGRFTFTVPDAGQSKLIATKGGYVSATLEVPRVAATTASAYELEIRLVRGAAISGQVLDRSGAPAVGTKVVARVDGSPSNARNPVTFEAETDDLGEYRIGGLPAGRYSVSAGSPPSPMTRSTDRGLLLELIVRQFPLALGKDGPFAPQLAQGPPDPTRAIDVRPGDEAGDVSFQVESLGPLDPVALSRLLAERTAIQGPHGAIRGRVMMHTGEPVGGAQVRATGSGSMRMVLTDADGHFDLDRLGSGNYTLEASRSGYVDLRYGPEPDVPGGQRIRLTSDSPVNGVDVVLSRGGAVTGTIVDEFGDPLRGVRAQAMQLRHEGGRTVAIRVGRDRPTDDRGRYRVFGLSPGSYLLVSSVEASASSSDRARSQGFVPVYYPGTASIEDAQPLQVEMGGDVTGVDLAFAPSFSARVFGIALDGGGQPLIGSVRLAVSQRSGAIATEPHAAPIGPGGAFELVDVSPGDYVVQAFGEPAPGRAAEFGAEYVSVSDRDPLPVIIKTSAGATLEGRFIVEGMPDPPMAALSIHALTGDVDRGPVTVRGLAGLAVYDDGRFYLKGLHGLTRFVLTNPTAGWYLKSLTVGGVDATDAPFDFGSAVQTYSDTEIVLSTSGASIAGSVTEDATTRAISVVVVAFSTSPDKWFTGSRHVKRARSGANGSFDINGLPPGEYWVAAVDAIGAGDWQTPDFLDGLVPRATRLTVGEGQVYTTALRLIRR